MSDCTSYLFESEVPVPNCSFQDFLGSHGDMRKHLLGALIPITLDSFYLAYDNCRCVLCVILVGDEDDRGRIRGNWREEQNSEENS